MIDGITDALCARLTRQTYLARWVVCSVGRAFLFKGRREMTKERVETLSKLAREYGFQTLYAVTTLFIGLPWLAIYVVLPIANDHRNFLKATADVQSRIAMVQEHQAMTLDRIERFVEVHCREQSKLQQAISKAKP